MRTFLFLVLMVSACDDDMREPSPPDLSVSQVGGECLGNRGLTCAPGLKCCFPDYPDAGHPIDHPQGSPMSQVLLAIVTNTPHWVWYGLAAIVVAGASQLRTRDLSPTRLLLVPVVMGAYSLLGTFNAFAQAGGALAVAAWLAGAALGHAANGPLGLPRGATANADGSVRIPGSAAPLALFLGIFLMRYVLGATLAMHPALRADAAFATVAALACGVPAGLLAARSRKALAARRGGTPAAA